MKRTQQSILPDGLIRQLQDSIGSKQVSADLLDLSAVAADASHYLLTPGALVRATTADDNKLVLAKELRLGGNEPEKRRRKWMDAPWTLLCGGGRRARGYLGREYKGRR